MKKRPPLTFADLQRSTTPELSARIPTTTGGPDDIVRAVEELIAKQKAETQAKK